MREVCAKEGDAALTGGELMHISQKDGAHSTAMLDKTYKEKLL